MSTSNHLLLAAAPACGVTLVLVDDPHRALRTSDGRFPPHTDVAARSIGCEHLQHTLATDTLRSLSERGL